jgi:hypothetical protein
LNEILNGYDFSSKQAEGIYSTPSARYGFYHGGLLKTVILQFLTIFTWFIINKLKGKATKRTRERIFSNRRTTPKNIHTSFF